MGEHSDIMREGMEQANMYKRSLMQAHAETGRGSNISRRGNICKHWVRQVSCTFLAGQPGFVSV